MKYRQLMPIYPSFCQIICQFICASPDVFKKWWSNLFWWSFDLPLEENTLAVSNCFLLALSHANGIAIWLQKWIPLCFFFADDLKGKLYRDHGSTINSHRSCAHNSCNAGHGHLAVFCAPVHAPQEVSIPPHPLAYRLVVPYAIGALYNHPLEGLLLDTFGGAISFLISGMTARTSVIFFCFAMIKTVDDHCGLWLPGNIFHTIFQNNTAYHGIHHQLQIGTSSLGPICLTH